ncbi:HD domain-containing protein [soil metagenome]
MDRLKQEIDFILEIDKLKGVLRQSYLTVGDRRENSAEHSWHLATMALVLAEHATEAVDLPKVLKMLLIHDIVEIDAGDVFFYDAVGNVGKLDRERQAADRLFNLLPPDQASEFRALWDEFEVRQSPEARFAAALDRLMPLFHNYQAKGRGWKEHGVTADQVMDRCGSIAEGSPTLWKVAQDLISDSVAKGYLAPAK